MQYMSKTIKSYGGCVLLRESTICIYWGCVCALWECVRASVSSHACWVRVWCLNAGVCVRQWVEILLKRFLVITAKVLVCSNFTEITTLPQHTMYFLQGVHVRKPMERLRRGDNIDGLIFEREFISRAFNNLKKWKKYLKHYSLGDSTLNMKYRDVGADLCKFLSHAFNWINCCN